LSNVRLWIKKGSLLAVSEPASAFRVCLLNRACPCLVSFDCILALHSTERKNRAFDIIDAPLSNLSFFAAITTYTYTQHQLSHSNQRLQHLRTFKTQQSKHAPHHNHVPRLLRSGIASANFRGTSTSQLYRGDRVDGLKHGKAYSRRRSHLRRQELYRTPVVRRLPNQRMHRSQRLVSLNRSNRVS
jgi:hypothetical protein